MTPLVKQVSIAVTPSGIVGVGKDLLMLNYFDLREFMSYTNSTVMIAGYNTAQQMVDTRLILNANRPMIVISANSKVDVTLADPGSVGFIYYAVDLNDAIRKAESLADHFGLIGWTVVGGVQVYNELISQLDKGSVRLNSSFIHVVQEPTVKIPREMKISCGLKALQQTIEARMISPNKNTLSLGVSGKDFSKAYVRSESSFEWTVDENVFDKRDVSVIGMNLILAMSAGETIQLKLSSIIGFSEHEAVNSITLHFAQGKELNVRLKHNTVGGVNYLAQTLRKKIK